MPRHQRADGGLHRAGTPDIVGCPRRLLRRLVRDNALAPGIVLHPERRLQQAVQLGTDLRVGAAAAPLVLGQQGGLLLLVQLQRIGQSLDLLLPGRALAAEDLVQRRAVDGRTARQFGHRAGIACDGELQALGQFSHGFASQK